MRRIFISHSHSDETIAHKLFDFIKSALKLDDDDILCTSDPDSGLTFNSNTISDQLKRNLKGAKALIALITTDSLRSPWIPFEIGSFWPTEKPIILILGPGLSPSSLPGPLKGWNSIRVEDEHAFDLLNTVINQLDKQLDIRQNNKRSQRDRFLKEFLSQFRAWESKITEPDTPKKEEFEKLEKQLQKSEQEKEEIRQSHQKQNQQLEQSLQSQINHLKQQLKEKEKESNHLRENNNNYQRKKQKIEELSKSQIDELNHQLKQQIIQFQSEQDKVREKESIINQLKEQLKQLENSSKSDKKKEPELKSERGIDYSQLRDLLAARKWKEANRETVDVMLQAAGRQEQGCLDIDDIDEFPCEDLRTINQLWLQFSNGKFGFSVQKEIYESVGGTRNYDKEIWEKFCDKVGWRNGEKYVEYSKLNFNITACDKGHLPIMFLVGKIYVEMIIEYSSLAQRLVTCNIN